MLSSCKQALNKDSQHGTSNAKSKTEIYLVPLFLTLTLWKMQAMQTLVVIKIKGFLMLMVSKQETKKD